MPPSRSRRLGRRRRPTLSRGACVTSTPGSGRRPWPMPTRPCGFSPVRRGRCWSAAPRRPAWETWRPACATWPRRRSGANARPACTASKGWPTCAVKRYDKALQAAERARKINPKEPRVYGLRGQVLGAQKGLSAALEDLNKAVDARPGVGLRLRRARGGDRRIGTSTLARYAPDFVRLSSATRMPTSTTSPQSRPWPTCARGRARPGQSAISL